MLTQFHIWHGVHRHVIKTADVQFNHICSHSLQLFLSSETSENALKLTWAAQHLALQTVSFQCSRCRFPSWLSFLTVTASERERREWMNERSVSRAELLIQLSYLSSACIVDVASSQAAWMCRGLTHLSTVVRPLRSSPAVDCWTWKHLRRAASPRRSDRQTVSDPRRRRRSWSRRPCPR